MLKNEIISINIDGEIECNLQVFFDSEKLARKYTVHSLTIGALCIAKTWSELADFSEMFNAFLKNCLNKDEKYRRRDYFFTFLKEELKPPIFVIAVMDYENNRNWKYYRYTKERSLLIYNKITKILNKCDFGEHDGQAIR